MNKYRWCTSESQESFHDDFATREEAIAFGKTEYDGRRFWIAKCRIPQGRELYPDADYITEYIENQACDVGGEFAEDYPGALDKSFTEELHALLDKYLSQPTFWIVWDAEKIWGEPRIPNGAAEVPDEQS